ncbi:hypothetical protein [Flavobacterium psychrophilum]|uniref:hypothetical protein n=1 Tax=Flavobacterium psychrophilum TaxID=96345 RepID=UPI000B7C0FFE|nr:hypothetical protein [Flavobacterium psychrophilum]SNA77389.1 putative prophage protein [Flavobacterium psychrophilum]
MSLQNISFRQLFQLKSQKFEEYHSLLSHLTPIKLTDSIGSLTDLTFGEVAEIKRSLQRPTFENTTKLFEIIFKIDQKKLYKINVIEFYHALNWIKHEVQSVYNREVENLSPDTDSKLKDAGVDELNIFGEMNTLIALGEKFSKAPQEVENWSYNLVFSLMLHQKISSDINKRYVELNKPVNND